MKRCTAKGFGLKSDEVCDRKAPEIAAMQNHYVNVNPKGFKECRRILRLFPCSFP